MRSVLRRFAFTVVLPGLVLLGFGLRAIDQDRRGTHQQLLERLQRAAGVAARAIDRQLVDWRQFRDDGLTVQSEPGLKISPRDYVAFLPSERIVVAAAHPGLAEAIHMEQVRGKLNDAIALYQEASKARDPQLKSAALARLASCYRKAGQIGNAIQTYLELLPLGKVQIGVLSAELIARFELCLLGAEDRSAFYRDLVAGRWTLEKTRYLFYSEIARDWASDPHLLRTESEKIAMAEAVEEFLRTRRRIVGNYLSFSTGQESVLIPVAKLRARLESLAILDPELSIRLVDSKSQPPSIAALHRLSDPELPWSVEAAPKDASSIFAGADQRRSIYLALLLLVFALLIVGVYATERAVKRELELARLRTDFVATVSHEFRSPLTAIRQLSELLQRGRVPSEEKRQEYYTLISRESNRLSRLVENLLDFSRLEEGRKQYRLDRMETADWLREIVMSCPREHVTLSIPKELPPIMADRLALTSAVDNLLDNAIKYSPLGTPVVCEAEAVGEELTIRVRDQGYGIAEADRAHVFEKFYRGKADISRHVKGAGVGLSLVRQIVEAHGGAVDFESRVGEGSVFRIRLKIT